MLQHACEQICIFHFSYRFTTPTPFISVSPKSLLKAYSRILSTGITFLCADCRSMHFQFLVSLFIGLGPYKSIFMREWQCLPLAL